MKNQTETLVPQNILTELTAACEYTDVPVECLRALIETAEGGDRRSVGASKWLTRLRDCLAAFAKAFALKGESQISAEVDAARRWLIDAAKIDSNDDRKAGLAK